MIRKYRTRLQRIQAIRVTLGMTRGEEPWPKDCHPTNVMPGDYLVLLPGQKYWVPMHPTVFEEAYELDHTAEILRIAK